jgi:2-keto-4-pentenoate hydratase/2-oxohepta-3-ene-1,7-dioic acid hydratase in catechol pathway
MRIGERSHQREDELRLISFRPKDGGAERPGALVGDEVVAFDRLDPDPPARMIDFLEAGAEGMRRAAELIESGEGRLPVSEVRLTAPVRPRKFFAIGLNYADHVAESGLERPENMTVFAKAITCVVGTGEDVVRPVVSEMLDYEGELGFVIGRRCRHVSAADAPKVIAGYTVVNDFSVRDWQMMTPQWSIGKSFDTHGPIGPAIVTADELGDPHALDIATFVNGEQRQGSNTKQLIFNCFDQVEILSKVCTLEPGDVIATGTPAGVAGVEKPPRWLVPGDRVRVEIAGIGALENEIVQEPEPDPAAW